jgi:hypothetical protein
MRVWLKAENSYHVVLHDVHALNLTCIILPSGREPTFVACCPVLLSHNQFYNPALPLLAKQLLLALSPLHAQLLPRPETAFMCPSSFPAAVGKALAGQLLARPVLDMFQHQEAHLTVWHVHWHMGLRRYAAAKRQQQQREVHGGIHNHVASGGRSWPESGISAAAELDELYMDPDAKQVAVHIIPSLFSEKHVD